ncbi:MAG: DJ-1/PfpI/YhbO family deglycase/protease [Thermoplasmata archaeon]|nr:type 1 glutamine amidotransferase [Thermoplasmata archaeon]NIS12728.1 type 1 glutamine amidotransferase [Thermoplasmata archaeon]NIS20645.1 type 1 glutamine amidotransferase [Thermoplasmata archaeon]NIT78030.1 type 1 glutamine amidotransferase [Thermoplasmata archaeon]NIU49717.1 type 1 glutamine amidotransferase [Thermoplasmata archaeon]
MSRVLLIVDEGFEDLELYYPKLRLIEAGHTAHVATPDGKPRSGKRGYSAAADLAIPDAEAGDYDALVVPGGSRSPEQLRVNEDALALVSAFEASGKTIASICHGPWLLGSAGALQGKRATCYFMIRDDVRNAGAEYVDEEVVGSGNLITSRTPVDLPAFMRTLLARLEN